jgi:hypothetical protein
MQTVETAKGPVEIGKAGLGSQCCSFMGLRVGRIRRWRWAVLGVGGV